MLFRAVEHREFSKFCKFGARYLKNGWSHKKFCLYLKSSKSGQKYIRTKKITKNFFYYATQNFALLPKNDHGPNFVHRIFLITSDSRKCFKKETFLPVYFPTGHRLAARLYYKCPSFCQSYRDVTTSSKKILPKYPL